ncbi:uncharacterized protein ASPGLDRAFT_24955 [Aspergillus glaucus CBS 516.65]|uniref:Uncharacterized protein n=1 Tax=Aspergillus glaucus CBS 516.65 TaxID=1160497 RepID=A0A1L9VMI0_ASPGL|nr:hypothetical protein ASPGLDRAFT_24955 [Aspergillus glaucus CBS 516.65]OJJ85101.1 hypothetical protein ASPGLDRAFT_24955 [Aspergillus glaucus CBS 516.65]
MHNTYLVFLGIGTAMIFNMQLLANAQSPEWVFSAQVLNLQYLQLYYSTKEVIPNISPAPDVSVLAELFGFIGKNPTPRKYIGAGEMLSKTEAETVMQSSSKIHLTDAEKEQYILSVAQTLSSEDIDDVIEKTAKEAYQNAKDVQSAFMKATVGLLVGLREEGLVSDRLSIPLSRNIAQYGDKFDDEVISLCTNLDFSIDQRKAKIAQYISIGRPIGLGTIPAPNASLAISFAIQSEAAGGVSTHAYRRSISEVRRCSGYTQLNSAGHGFANVLDFENVTCRILRSLDNAQPIVNDC